MSRIQEIISEAREHLAVAKSGDTMIAAGLGQAKIGLRNIAVFGRMVTFATNNLRSIVEGFEQWDVDAKKRHFDNEACRYMYNLRNIIEKQARTPVSMSAYVASINTNDLRKFPRPPGATSFFIGDQNGGSGWMIVDREGNEIPYYVSLPPEIGRVWLRLTEYRDMPVQHVAKAYLNALDLYLSEVSGFVGLSI